MDTSVLKENARVRHFFVAYFMMPSASKHRRIVDKLKDLKENSPVLRYYPGMCLEGLNITAETSVTINQCPS
jgi:hypothetical protein